MIEVVCCPGESSSSKMLELDTLNKLIADEQEAIKGYFEAAKNTNNEFLVKLYSDIGDEERFHTEQLLQAKAQLTNETYPTSDKEVTDEENELINEN